jgi:succinoglycan biosynthesis protein ExoU
MRATAHRDVAVVVPACNAAATIERALGSALDQPEVAEVVLVDDGSDDGTAQRARFADDGSGRLRIIAQPNAGPSAAVNRGQAATRAPFFCVLDADDFFLPGRLEAIFEAAGDDWDLAADRPLILTEGQEAGPFERWTGEIPASGELTFAAFVEGNISRPDRPGAELGFLQPVFRRAFLEDRGLRHDEAVRLGEDYLLYAAALAAGARFRVVADAGYVIVRRAASLSQRHSVADLAALLAADRRLLQHPSLSAADREVLRRHIAHVHRKLQYRRALEAKKHHRWREAAAAVCADFGVLGYVLSETARARLGARTDFESLPRASSPRACRRLTRA